MKKKYVCSSCQSVFQKWNGQCNSCNEWNTIEEEVILPKKIKNRALTESNSKPVLLSRVETGNDYRIRLPGKELNRVLGGGMVPGSIILLGGQPGIGKSTLMLQSALKLKKKVLYVTGEESQQQVKMRADRITEITQNCYIFTETNIAKIEQETKKMRPDLLIVDSIQTIFSDDIDATPGSVSQVRENAHRLQQFAKSMGIPVFLIGHITKEGQLAGPKLLEHIVDVVLQFEGDKNYTYRILRSIKNRFGSTSELGIYEMTEAGLREISNPSELLLSQSKTALSGCATSATMEGQRALLIETQALVSSAVYGNPQRSATGFESKRMNMLLAVLEKKCGFFLGNQDVFLNIAGGIKAVDPAMDLAVVAAIISSMLDISIPKNISFVGEVGLTGEIRASSRLVSRIQESERTGFKKVFVPNFGLKEISKDKMKIEIIPLETVQQLHTFISEM